MLLITKNHTFGYELQKLCMVFYPDESIIVKTECQESDRIIITELDKGSTSTTLSVSLIIDQKQMRRSAELANDNPEYYDECERILAVLLFECLTEITGYVPEWGILTGVRPAKLMRRLIEEYGRERAAQYFKQKLFVNDSKIKLCLSALEGEETIINLSRPESYSLYISIPFCPSRCSYCSFVSHSVDKAKRLIPDYVDLICQELEYTARIAKDCGLRIETIYMGGGTPTVLNQPQLTQIMKTVSDCFDLSTLREYTVEAGRPDTITIERLEAIKQGGATRISINPQSMNDNVLMAIGRKHTSQQTVEAFKLARSLGFNNINMDLIAGLPSDTLESFSKTVDEILGLNPESVTVHTLSFKRSSRLSSAEGMPVHEARTAAQMLELANQKLESSGFFPYYMYRQAKMVDNLENVGYAKKGYEGLYNVYIMDETHTILGAGAAAVTKLKQPCGSYIERVFNFKYPYEYVSRFKEILRRKERVKEFYEQYRIPEDR